jgi:hypothetical protein
MSDSDLSQRLSEFSNTVQSKTDAELFETLLAYNIAFNAKDADESHEEALHKGLYATMELHRRYATELAAKYSVWLQQNGKLDPWFTLTPSLGSLSNKQ